MKDRLIQIAKEAGAFFRRDELTNVVSKEGHANYVTNIDCEVQEFLEKEVLPDVETLEALVRENGLSPADAAPCAYESMAEKAADVRFADDVPSAAPAGRDLRIQLRWEGEKPAEMHLRFRHTNQREGYYRSLPMNEEAGVFSAVIPAEYLTPEWDLIVFFSGRSA